MSIDDESVKKSSDLLNDAIESDVLKAILMQFANISLKSFGKKDLQNLNENIKEMKWFRKYQIKNALSTLGVQTSNDNLYLIDKDYQNIKAKKNDENTFFAEELSQSLNHLKFLSSEAVRCSNSGYSQAEIENRIKLVIKTIGEAKKLCEKCEDYFTKQHILTSLDRYLNDILSFCEHIHNQNIAEIEIEMEAYVSSPIDDLTDTLLFIPANQKDPKE